MPMLTREQILKEIERDGIEKTKSRILQKRPRDRKEYEKIIHEIESSEASSRKEESETKALSVAREANKIATSANAEARAANLIASKAFTSNRRSEIAAWIAAIAAIVAAITVIIQYIKTP